MMSILRNPFSSPSEAHPPGVARGAHPGAPTPPVLCRRGSVGQREEPGSVTSPRRRSHGGAAALQEPRATRSSQNRPESGAERCRCRPHLRGCSQHERVTAGKSLRCPGKGGPGPPGTPRPLRWGLRARLRASPTAGQRGGYRHLPQGSTLECAAPAGPPLPGPSASQLRPQSRTGTPPSRRG